MGRTPSRPQCSYGSMGSSWSSMFRRTSWDPSPTNRNRAPDFPSRVLTSRPCRWHPETDASRFTGPVPNIRNPTSDDKDKVIDIPAPLRHLLVRGIILRTRPKKIAPLYKKIWMDDGSPLRVYSKRVTDNLTELNQEIDFEFGMRYGNPSIRQGLEQLKSLSLIHI